MYVLIAGGGKVGANLTRSLLRAGHEVTLDRAAPLPVRQARGRVRAPGASAATRPSCSCSSVPASSGRPICSSPRRATTRTTSSSASSPASGTASANVIARINDPRNQPYFDLLGISPTVSRDRRDHGPDRARGARARPDPPARAAQGEPRDRRGDGRQGRELPGQASAGAAAPGRRAADLGRPRRQGRDPR